MYIFQDLNFAVIVALLTIVFGVLVKMIGFPDQIRKNYKRKSTTALSTTFILLSFVAYSLWTIHGFLRGDLVLMIGQGVGIITTGIILYQIWLYRNNHD